MLLARRAFLGSALAASLGAARTQPSIDIAPLAFPRDFGAHPDTAIEWWYATGALRDGARRYGFQITFFRAATRLAADSPSRFAPRQLVFAHAAVSDVASRRLRHDQRSGRGGFTYARAGIADTDVVLRDWSLTRVVDAAAPFGAAYRTHAASDAGAFAFDLDLAPTQPVLLQGSAGVSRKGPEAAQYSRYYSEPQLATRGTLVLDGRRVGVEGRAWLDHEWSDSILDPSAVGWDWIGMNLDDGAALTAFRLRRPDGSALWAGGSFRPRGGATRDFAPSEVAFTPGRRWTSPASKAAYPVEWRVATPAGPFDVRALLDAQELDALASTGAVYWEGIADLHDGSGKRVGSGYLEMTGYARRLVL